MRHERVPFKPLTKVSDTSSNAVDVQIADVVGFTRTNDIIVESQDTSMAFNPSSSVRSNLKTSAVNQIVITEL
jgi:uncharacterized phage protein gp47/JayE